MNAYQSLYPQLEKMGLEQWAHTLKQTIPDKLAADGHGNMEQWQSALKSMPELAPSHVMLKDKIEIGCEADLVEHDRDYFLEQLKQFHPWRKGPFSLFGLDIDTEWRSDWKWDRVLPHIQSLQDRKVLDIGGGNGYHGWRMIGEGANLVIGIDPTLVFIMQYQLMQKYLGDRNHYVLPIGIEELPNDLGCFDTVFSMGVLYHRRSPIDHLYELRSCLRPGGELVLETLIIEGEGDLTFMPEDRYAKMRNVWFIPSIATMRLWLRRGGFKQIRCVDVNVTSLEEQRQTDWMIFESLADFLDPEDRTKTIEGHPAPVRATFIATAPK